MESEASWKRAMLPATATIQQALHNLNELGIRIVLVVNGKGELEGTVCDGDIRRGLLRGLNLSDSIEGVVYRKPFVVPKGLEHGLIMQLMATNKVLQVPIIDENNRVVGLYVWDEIALQPERQNVIVIMAGGIGARMHPRTESCPKPMLPVADRPILEHIIERAKSDGFQRFMLAIRYLGHMIERHFGDGHCFNVQIDYLREESPLGTAGALSLLEQRPKLPIVVSNGDLLTDIHFGDLLEFHSRQGSSATMAVRIHEWQNPYGVVQLNGLEIAGFEEKPIVRNHINAGVYVLEPTVLDCLERGAYCDMPTLFERIKATGKRIVAYPMHEPWLDVGMPADLEVANTLNKM